MKTFLTILQIVYGPAGEPPIETYVAYESEYACGTALLLVDELIDPAYDILIARCVVTEHETPIGAPTTSPRPVARPWTAL